jgi:hypothetical protein
MPRPHKFWRLEIHVAQAPSSSNDTNGILDMLRYENATVISGPDAEGYWEIEMPHAPSAARWASFAIPTRSAWVVTR